MPTKNILLWILLSIAFIVGYMYFQSVMWPRKLPDQAQPEVPPVKPATTWAFAGKGKLESDAIVATTEARLFSLGSGPAVFGHALTELAVLNGRWPKPEPIKPPVAPTREPERITLGDHETHKKYKLSVVLTDLGAGVEKVTLTQFEGADRFGLPANTPLDLVPATGEPSHLIFHYQKPDDNRPVETLGKLHWTLKEADVNRESEQQKVIYEATLHDQQLQFTKTYTLGRGDYHIGLSVKIKRLGTGGADAPKFKYQLTGAHGLPIEGEWYTYTFRNALIGWVDKKGDAWRHLEDSARISHLSGGDIQDRGDKSIIYAGIAVQYFASVVAVDNDQQNTGFIQSVRSTLEAAAMKGKVRITGPDSFVLASSGSRSTTFRLGREPGLREKFEGLKDGQGVCVIWRMEGDHFVATDLRSESDTNPLFFDDITVRLISEPLTVAKDTIEHKYLLYNGPVKVQQLAQLRGERSVDSELVARYVDGLHLNTLTDYQSPGWGGSFASSIGLTYLIIKFTNLMHWLLNLLHLVLPVYGLNIIMLTVIVRGIMFPISRRQMNNQLQMQEKMAKLQPEFKKLQEKYRDDYSGLQQAKTELMLRHNINPLSTLGGCLLMFAQMPIFLGLYYALQESIHFRLNEFLWMRNLAAPDMLIWWSESIPMLSTPASQGGFLYLGPFFNLLPIVAVGLMIVQQKMLTPPPTDEQQEMQQKMMKWMMIVFGFMFYKVAAGLCIYFIASSIWGVMERKLFPPPKPAPVGGLAPPSGPSGNGDGGGKGKSRGPKSGGGKAKSSRDGKDENGGKLQKLKSWWEEVLEQAKKK